MRAERGVGPVGKKGRDGLVGGKKGKRWSRLMVLALAIECISKEQQRSDRPCRTTKDRDLGRGQGVLASKE